MVKDQNFQQAHISLNARQLSIKFKHPDCTTSGPTGRTWVGSLAFVDDLVLLYRIPDELQNMLDTCQRWCEKARIEINT